MKETRTSRERGVTIVRWSARVWSIASVGFVLLMFVGSGLAEGFNPAQFAFRDLVGLFFFPFGVCLGMILAWRWEGLGEPLPSAAFSLSMRRCASWMDGFRAARGLRSWPRRGSYSWCAGCCRRICARQRRLTSR